MNSSLSCSLVAKNIILKQVSLEQMLNWFYWQKNCETTHNQVAELDSCKPLHGNPIYWTTDAQLYKIAPLQLRLFSLHLAIHPPSSQTRLLFIRFIPNTVALSLVQPHQDFQQGICWQNPQNITSMLIFITGSTLPNSFFFFKLVTFLLSEPL